jgi:hypothetical protein
VREKIFELDDFENLLDWLLLSKVIFKNGERKFPICCQRWLFWRIKNLIFYRNKTFECAVTMGSFFYYKTHLFQAFTLSSVDVWKLFGGYQIPRIIKIFFTRDYYLLTLFPFDIKQGSPPSIMVSKPGGIWLFFKQVEPWGLLQSAAWEAWTIQIATKMYPIIILKLF